MKKELIDREKMLIAILNEEFESLVVTYGNEIRLDLPQLNIILREDSCEFRIFSYGEIKMIFDYEEIISFSIFKKNDLHIRNNINFTIKDAIYEYDKKTFKFEFGNERKVKTY